MYINLKDFVKINRTTFLNYNNTYGQPSIDVQESRPMGRGRKAGGASDGDEQGDNLLMPAVGFS